MWTLALLLLSQLCGVASFSMPVTAVLIVGPAQTYGHRGCACACAGRGISVNEQDGLLCVDCQSSSVSSNNIPSCLLYVYWYMSWVATDVLACSGQQRAALQDSTFHWTLFSNSFQTVWGHRVTSKSGPLCRIAAATTRISAANLNCPLRPLKA
jgi:hypothetical protein